MPGVPGEPVQRFQDAGQVEDVMLDGQLLLHFLRQLLVRVAVRLPGNGSPQIGQAAWGRGQHGFPGDLSDVKPAVTNGGYRVADAHLCQEGVQLVDEAALLYEAAPSYPSSTKRRSALFVGSLSSTGGGCAPAMETIPSSSHTCRTRLCPETLEPRTSQALCGARQPVVR